jgi:uncharacterized protein (DUF1778 family)
MYVLSEYSVPMSVVGEKGRGRINLRVNPDQEARLRAAAEANGETLTGFLLVAGTERAEEVLERSRRIAVSGDAFDLFVAALDADVEPMPTLKRYAEEPSSIPSR